MNGSGKHSSLIQYGNNYGRKKFQSTGIYLIAKLRNFRSEESFNFPATKMKKKHLSVFATAPRICPVRNNPERNNPERNNPNMRNNPERPFPSQGWGERPFSPRLA